MRLCFRVVCVVALAVLWTNVGRTVSAETQPARFSAPTSLRTPGARSLSGKMDRPTLDVGDLAGDAVWRAFGRALDAALLGMEKESQAYFDRLETLRRERLARMSAEERPVAEQLTLLRHQLRKAAGDGEQP